MNAQEFLSLAGKLVASPSASEAACRTAVSRAYYACFHSAKDYLIELGFRMGRNHGLPQRMLMSAGVEASLRAGQLLGNLQSERIWADYDLASSRVIDNEIARHCVEVAHEFLTLLTECRQEPLQNTIRTGIETYQRKIAPPSDS